MSKPKLNPRTMAQASKLAMHHIQDVTEMALDVGKQIMRDQAEWLDAQMKDLLPPDLYEMGQRGEGQQEISDYAHKHGIQVILVPDSMAVRILLNGQPHSQFVPTFTVDGEPVTKSPLDSSKN